MRYLRGMGVRLKARGSGRLGADRVIKGRDMKEQRQDANDSLKVEES